MPLQLRSKLLCLLVLVGVTLAVYWPATHFDFTNYDDPEYLLYNPNIQHGINRGSVAWALAATYASNWHPLTWMSHMADWSLYGNQPRGHHLTNLLLHAANVALLFFLLLRLTGKNWRGALVAALFAWHPLHVESVAWVSERKDLLSTFFMLLTLLAYASYAGKAKAGNPGQSARRLSKPVVYLYFFLSLLLFALGLMSKPMLVTLPFVLLLLDYWPLERFSRMKELNFKFCVLEKIPFLFIAYLDGKVTILAQQGTHSVVGDATLPFSIRLSNALVSCVRYLGKTIWPTDLALPYPYSEWNFSETTAAAIILLGITAWVLFRLKRQPFLAVGWFWFLITLLPVIGLMQVGSQAMADRYTYIPLIGIFIIAAWVIPADWFSWPRPGLIAGAACAGILIFLVMGTEVQLQYWRNSVSLFGHTAAITRNNILAEYNLAEALARSGDQAAAVIHYQRALEIVPNRIEARQYNSKPNVNYNLGLIFRQNKRWAEAAAQFGDFVKAEPRLASGHANLGIALLALGQDETGKAELAKSLRINSSRVNPLQLLAITENAYAEASLFDKSLATALQLQTIAQGAGDEKNAAAAQKRIAYYQTALNSVEKNSSPEK